MFDDLQTVLVVCWGLLAKCEWLTHWCLSLSSFVRAVKASAEGRWQPLIKEKAVFSTKKSLLLLIIPGQGYGTHLRDYKARSSFVEGIYLQWHNSNIAYKLKKYVNIFSTLVYRELAIKPVQLYDFCFLEIPQGSKMAKAPHCTAERHHCHQDMLL